MFILGGGEDYNSDREKKGGTCRSRLYTCNSRTAKSILVSRVELGQDRIHYPIDTEEKKKRGKI